MNDGEPLAWEPAGDLGEYLTRDRENHMGYGDALSHFAMVEQRDGNRYLVWTCHHAITDGHMHRLILRRVEAAYKCEPMARGATAFNHFVKYIRERDSSRS